MRMGVSLGLAGRGRQVFSPRLLFQNAEPGFWADVQPSVLWQDTGRTTPVTADGDPVASWALNTASGVIYATQSTAGNRPVYKVDAGGRGYLEFNGATSSRWLVTPTITPGTNKVQVIAGVRKNTDAAAGMVAELSASTGTNPGTFLMAAPVTAAANFGWNACGSGLPGTLLAVTYTAPLTAVLTGTGDIPADSRVLRVNGVNAISSGSDMFSGNFLAYPLYIGARGGTSLFLNGRVYGLIVRFGANLDASRILDAERWMARRVGV